MLSATSDGAALLAITHGADNGTAQGRLLTVTATGSRVDDLPELIGPNNRALSSFSILNSVMSTSSSGNRWVFLGQADPFTAVRETDTGRMRSSILPQEAALGCLVL